MKEGFIPRILLAAAGIFMVLSATLFCTREDSARSDASSSLNARYTAEYRGRESCRECHEKEYNLYLGSDHDMAMDVANEETVLGDFSNVSFTHFGVTSRFFISDGK